MKALQNFDVVIVGAGLSGIGAAYFLQQRCPNKTVTILESRAVSGGTWDLFRYPGIRSDSSMLSLGYSFKPWLGDNHLADGASILNYIREAASENGIDQHIQYHHKVVRAEWDSADANWKLQIEYGEQREHRQIQCNFLLLCAGYYNYTNGYTPDFKGREQFEGQIIHPQKWPDDFAYRDKKIVVIGSGATAVTLVPELAKKATHVTLLQRSPSYMVPRPTSDRWGNLLRRVLPLRLAHRINRWRNIEFQRKQWARSRNQPEEMRQAIIQLIRSALPEDFDVDTHFNPLYNPLDQRLCPVPDGILFDGIKNGTISIVTDHIETFTQNGLLLESGDELSADVIITATGLNMTVMGGIEFMVDGKNVDFGRTVAYKGMMINDVPNMIFTFGYINASWTLRSDLTAEYAARLIAYLNKTGQRICTPRITETEKVATTNPFVTEFSPGYLKRSLHLLPKQGTAAPWLNPQNYQQDIQLLRHEPLDDGVLEFKV